MRTRSILLAFATAVGVAITAVDAATAQGMPDRTGPGMMHGGMGSGMGSQMGRGMMMGSGMMGSGMMGSGMMQGARGPAWAGCSDPALGR